MSQEIDHEKVRRLRGTASRAAFAKRVGVTPHTVYRWELPDDAKEARRPRGAELSRLLELSSDASAMSGAARKESPREATTAPTRPGADELADVLGAIDRVLRGDWHAGRAELLRIVTQARAPSPDARALGASGLAILDVLLRSDSRSALATLSPVLADAEEARLSPLAAAYVYAAAACAHALPDATLFDVGRAHAHAARAESLAHGDSPEIAFLAWLATVHVAVMVADDELLQRAFARLDLAPWSELPPLLALHEIEARALRASFSGQRALAQKLTEEVITAASERGYGLLEARGLAYAAVRRLDDLVDPENVLALARRSQQVARTARASPGAHTLFATRAEAESLLRMGRAAEALAALDELRLYTLETGLPPTLAMPAVARVHFLTGGHVALLAIAESLRACEVPSLRPMCRANALMLEALHLLASSDDPERTLDTFERASNEARNWNFLLRDVLVFGCTARVLTGSEAESRVAIRRAQRMLDRFPSPWASAHLRRVEGTLAAAHGQWSQGQKLLESAIATFESGGDVTDAALGRHMLAALARGYDEPDAESRFEESGARLEALGLRAPRGLRMGVERVLAERRADAGRAPHTGGIERLVSPLSRLVVPGAEPALVRRELCAIARELVASRPTRLEELDSNGEARLIVGAEGASSSFEWVELGDGAGRRFRLGAEGPLDEEARAALAVVGIAGGLALEVATLRGGAVVRGEGAGGEDDADVPGLIAASPSMRALRSEIAHLASSRATVVIQGESGTGKEVVARAIHDLSTRAKRPYVAFNCAAVPRELFEGQLFGYRRGSFTGATRDHPGVLRAAESGTIFLDEIGELPLDVQPKLLRFLENGEIFPLGEKRPQVIDVRVLCATHRDLGALVREQRFREDLYYRLQVIALRIAPLRDRPEDIAPLARHFLRQLSAAETPPILAPDALSKLTAYDWPGNVRELRNVLERALAYSPPPRILRAENLTLGRDQAR